MYPTSFPRGAPYLYDFNLHKTQKAHTKTKEDSLQNLGLTFIRSSFLDVVLKRLQISRKKLLGIHFRNAASVEKDSMQEVSLNVSQSPYIEY